MKRVSLNPLRIVGHGARYLSRFPIGARLAVCFVILIALMLAGDALRFSELRLVSRQAEELAALDQELIGVLRFQNSLTQFYDRLNELAQSRNTTELIAESDSLRAQVLAEAKRTEESFGRLPAELRREPTVLTPLEALQSELPSYLQSMNELAASGDWNALHYRLERQIQPMEAVGAELVRSIDQQVAGARAEAAANVRQAERRILLIDLVSGALMLLVAVLLGVAATSSITEPLGSLVEGSRALARGEFEHQIPVQGSDEYAHLAEVFNDTAAKLRDLYATLQNREAYLAEAQRLSHTGSWARDPKHQTVHWSEETLRIFGFEPGTTPTIEMFAERVHPEDRAGAQERDALLLQGREAEHSFRLMMPDGAIKYVRSVAHPVKDDTGKVVEFVGTIIDVTEQRTAHDQLVGAFEQIKTLRDQLSKENIALREEVNRTFSFEEILGSSEKLVRVLSDISRVAPSDSTVLVLGETGTGKELVARAIHKQSQRAARAFIRVNCAAIPPSLISSELFGHEKGAFTGASQRRLGRFEAANGGTIFLDEIGELPAETQAALLRVLQEREFERVGSNVPVSVDVRILAATNRDLEAAVVAGTFRADLFYRLNVFPIRMPPLRERSEDIPLLVEYFVGIYSQKVDKSIRDIRKSTLDQLTSYSWPGNVRELQNVVERAVLLCNGETLSVDEAWLKQETQAAEPKAGSPNAILTRIDSDREREVIEAALAASGGQVSGAGGAAASLGIPRQTLESKMARLGIQKRKYINS